MNQQIRVHNLFCRIRCIISFVEFKISNTKPNVYTLEDSEDRHSIGLQNIKKQLNLLYPNKYKLEIENTKENYSVRLKVSKDEI